MEGDKDRISFIKDVEIKDGKADTTYSALSNKTAKCGGAKSLSEFGSNEASAIIGWKKLP